ncbi:bifunctional oligoribonuclease/PAP phosphatase NrnA [Lactobacillus sp. DCY120]|uniref:Bifunctional oligoribonuclease/PAP phosphatase NrnA n=1 Tax=Bombilactobacillus apium TaxID=2675299 RepID=A0A850R8Q6_9LACO|nr:bifunctional oligoribonuclease/PAP phosphatase NrnA [Bombilactobacillus apium]NVY97112.1 bifunctional oligoribonuclease/PAP phosphatase NrnA [Bombilactobacillus apium]
MNTFGEIIEQIQKASQIIIHRHQNPDPDALGSQLGLARSIQTTYPEKTVLMAGEGVGDLDWIATMDQVADELYPQALVIVVDTANRPRISDQRYQNGQKIIKIDHHPNTDPYGDWRYVNTEASSCAEIIADLINAAGNNLQLTDEVAQALYTGIVGDTGRFLYPSTSSHTLHLAAQLVSYNFQPHLINQQMGQLTLSQARLQGYAFENLQIDASGAAKLVVSQAVLTKLGLDASQAHAIVGTPGRLQEVHSWLIGVQKPNQTYRVHLRSQGPVINELAAQHDGGGHPLASGANAQDEAELEEIFQALIQLQKQEN